MGFYWNTIMKKMELWVVNTRTLDLARRLDDLLARLPDIDCDKALRYRMPADRLRCAVGRVLIRSLAAGTIGVSEASLCFTDYGRPCFAGENVPQFNLSHSGDLVTLAIGGTPVGVDVEEVCEIDLALFDTWLSDEEKQTIKASQDALTAFYRIWTAREAFSKLDGRGICLFERGGAGLNSMYSDFDFRTFEVSGHILTLCADHIPAGLVPDVLKEDRWESLLQLL